MTFPNDVERLAVLNAVAAAIETHKYAQYGVCACGLDLGAEHGRYQEAWRGHLAHEQTEAALAALADLVDAREAQAAAGCCACHAALAPEVERLTTLLRLRTEALDRILLQRDEAVAAFKRERARVNRAEALACGPGEGMQPYAVDLDGEIHLAVLLDDLRAALADEGARP